MGESAEVHYARSGDIDIAYQILGDGPVDLVFVSGFISHLDFNWQFPWFNTLKALDGSARVIIFDKRGTGLSDRSIGFGSAADRMDDIRAVMDAAGSERAVLYGVSEGGPLCLLFAATYPDRVSKLIVYGSAACFVQKEDYPIGGIREWMDQFVEVMVSNWGKGLAYGMFIQDIPSGVESQQMVARFERNACTPNLVREILLSNLDIDVRSILPTISVPTLVLHNVGDPLIQVECGRYLGERISTATYIEGSGKFHGTWLPEKLKWLSDNVSAFLGATPTDAIDLDRVLATVLFTDIVGSTDKTAAVGDREWRSTLDRHDAIVRDEVSRYRGRLVNTTGDGVLATFDGPARGLRCAAAINGTVAGLGLAVRAGVHTGEVELRGDDITGLGVVIARRICDQAGAGEVLASRTVKDLVTGSGIGFVDKGSHSLKGVPDEWQLFAVAR